MKKSLIAAIILALAAMLISGCAEILPPSEEETALTEGEETGSPVVEEEPMTSLSTGTIKVLVTDAPGDVSEVNVTVSAVEVHKAGSDGASGEWVPLPIQQKTFNLIALQDISMLLAEGKTVDAGKYTQLRMTMFEVIVKTEDGPEVGYPATVPSNELKFVRPFTLKAGGEITLTVDIDAAKSVLFPGGKKGDVKKVIFKPVVKLMIEHEEEPGPSPTTNFNPTSGPSGTVITVTGTGWVADEVIDPVTVGGEAATHTLAVDVGGNLSGTITVPAGLAPGTYSIAITGATSGEQTFADAFEVTATAAFNPTSGPAETMITVTGTGWVSSEVIDPVTVGGEAATHTLVVDSGGNLSGTITVPVGLAPGTYSIAITGATSGEQTFADAFEVTT